MRRACAADLLVGGCAVALSVADVHFHRREMPMVTDTLRRPIVFACLLVLVLHAADVLGRRDPFRAVGRLIPRCCDA